MAKQIFTSEQLKQIYGTPQVEPQAPVPEKKQGIQKVLSGAKAAIGGFASGVGGIALTAEDYLARKAVNALPENFKVGNTTKQQMQQNLANSPKLQDQFKEQFGGNENSGAYGVGQLGGEIAALAAPVASVGKYANAGAKALGAGGTTAKIAQAGVEGIAFTAGQSITEGEKQSFKDFALNAGINMVFPAAGAAAKKIGQNVPERLINSLIKPLQKDFAYGKNPGKTVAELGITGNNFDELISNISSKKNEVGQSIGTTIQKVSPQLQSQIDLNTYLAPIDEAIALANKTPRTNQTLLARLEGVKADLVDNIGQGIDPQSFKGLVGDLTKWTGNATDDTMVNKALTQVYGKTASGMDDVLKTQLSPEEFTAYKKASEQYGNLISAENATRYRDNIVKRSDLISFGAKNTALIAALSTAVASGGGGITTILAGLGGAALDKSMASPAFKTRLAKILTKLAPKEVQTFFEKVPTAKIMYGQNNVDKIIEKSKEIIKKEGGQGGFITIGGKTTKAIDSATKKELEGAIDYIRLNKPVTPKMEDIVSKLQEKFGISSKTSSSKIADKFEDLITKTKTKSI